MADPVDVHNWRRLDDWLTTSGQPTEEQLAAIAALGVRTVVNLGLHTHERALPDETASLAALASTISICRWISRTLPRPTSPPSTP